MTNHPHFRAYLALASCCFFWGTTYLGIRVALESFSPAVLVSLRFLLSGSIIAVAVWRLGYRFPSGRELWQTAGCGLIILGLGTGCLVLSETLIPSSMAALFITLSPLWFSGIEALVPGGERFRPAVLGGLLTGLAGVALLVAPDLMARGFHGAVWQGFLILQLGCLGWSLGSILQKRMKSAAHPFAVGGVQQLAAGIVFIIPALLEPGRTADFSAKGTGALLYLVTFGSIIGYSSYVYALERLPVSLVSLYTYVNPLVAAALGWLFYREPFGKMETAAMLIIFLGVWLVKRYSRH